MLRGSSRCCNELLRQLMQLMRRVNQRIEHAEVI